MILLDTCTLLWLVAGHRRLPKGARREIAENVGMIFVSAMSAFEIGVKHKKGHLDLPLEPTTYYHRALELHGLREVPVSGKIAARSTQLPPLHRDPVDRMIVATAQLEGLAVLTPDPLIAAYPNTTVRW